MKIKSIVYLTFLTGLLFSILICCKKEAAKVIPTINIAAVTNITATTATSGGEITSDGGATVTARGVCWSLNQNPTIADSKTNSGIGTGGFVSSIIGLTPGNTFYLRAFATNSAGTAYSDAVSFTSLNVESLLSCIQAYPNIIGEIVTTYLKGELVTCSKINGEYFFQGDIVILPQTKAAALISQDNRWPANTVFYTINSNFLKNSRVSDAISEYGNKTNLTFKEHTNEPNYIEFIYDADGCRSNLGMIGGKQKIWIADWGDAGTVIHEIGHAISLLHEQSKSGRDNYVTIISENIIPGMEHNFDEYTNSLNTPGFDFNSIMLYHSWGFTKDSKKPTMTKRDGTTFIPQNKHLTESDIYLIDILYPSSPKLTTIAISSIANTSAVSGGNITSDGGTHVIVKGVCWSTSINPTTDNFKTTDGKDSGIFSSNITNLTTNTTYYLRAYATNSVGTSYGNEVTFKTSASGDGSGIIFNPNLTYGTLTDIDGNVYKTIKIGTQTWMAENLKTTKYRNGDPITNVTDNASWAALSTGAYCWYNNDKTTYKATYGALYNWYVVKDSRNIAPTGWHVPSDTEWTALTTYLGGESVAGDKLKEVGVTHWQSPNIGATNESGFTALPSGGRKDFAGTFYALGDIGFWWSSSTKVNDIDGAGSPFLGNTSSIFSGYSRKQYGFSVRCIKD